MTPVATDPLRFSIGRVAPSPRDQFLDVLPGRRYHG